MSLSSNRRHCWLYLWTGGPGIAATSCLCDRGFQLVKIKYFSNNIKKNQKFWMPCMVDLTGWNSFLAWSHTSSLQTHHCQCVSCVSTPAISKWNESWNLGLLLLWHLMHVWKLHIILNWGPRHTKSNVVIRTKTYCGTPPFISVHRMLFWESMVPRSYNRYRGARNRLFWDWWYSWSK